MIWNLHREKTESQIWIITSVIAPSLLYVDATDCCIGIFHSICNLMQLHFKASPVIISTWTCHILDMFPPYANLKEELWLQHAHWLSDTPFHFILTSDYRLFAGVNLLGGTQLSLDLDTYPDAVPYLSGNDSLLWDGDKTTCVTVYNATVVGWIIRLDTALHIPTTVAIYTTGK